MTDHKSSFVRFELLLSAETKAQIERIASTRNAEAVAEFDSHAAPWTWRSLGEVVAQMHLVEWAKEECARLDRETMKKAIDCNSKLNADVAAVAVMPADGVYKG